MAATKKRAKRKTKKPTRRTLPGKLTGAEINGFPIRRVRVADLTEADYNPREITDAALAGLKESVDAFGLVQAVVWNKRTRQIVGGHQRSKTLDPNAFTDVVEVDLTPDQEKALNLTLNNPHIMGDWTSGLSTILDEITSDDPDLALKLALNDLRVDVPTEFSTSPEVDDDFPEVDDSAEDQRECPKCGHQF